MFVVQFLNWRFVLYIYFSKGLLPFDQLCRAKITYIIEVKYVRKREVLKFVGRKIFFFKEGD